MEELSYMELSIFLYKAVLSYMEATEQYFLISTFYRAALSSYRAVLSFFLSSDTVWGQRIKICTCRACGECCLFSLGGH